MDPEDSRRLNAISGELVRIESTRSDDERNVPEDKVNKMFEICELAEKFGGIVTRPAGPMAGSDINMAFIADPDGYKIELLETTSNLD